MQGRPFLAAFPLALDFLRGYVYHTGSGLRDGYYLYRKVKGGYWSGQPRQLPLHFELGTRELSMALPFQLFGKIGYASNEKGNFGQY